MNGLFQSRFIVLDTETTGFANYPWARVVELAGAVVDEEGREVSAFETLVRPEIHDTRSSGAEKVHGLTKEMLKDAPLAGEAADRFRAWFREHIDLTARVTSYNRAFDQPMTERMGLDDLVWGPCIMEQVMELLGPRGVLRDADPKHPRYTPGKKWLWPSLVDAAKHLGVTVEGTPHRALTDVRIAAKVLVAVYLAKQAQASMMEI